MLHCLVYSQTAHLPIGELHFEDINGVSLDLVVLDLILCKRTNVKIEVSHPTQVRKWHKKPMKCEGA